MPIPDWWESLVARIRDDLGSKSQEYCMAWNAFNRIDSPPWMRVSHQRYVRPLLSGLTPPPTVGP